jgi:hypothetical protein
LQTHNPKVGGSNPPPATKLKLDNINHLKLFAEVLQIHKWLPLRSHQQTAAFHAVLLRSTALRPTRIVGEGPAQV